MYAHVVYVITLLLVSASSVCLARLVWGEEVDVASYPYMTSLQVFDRAVFKHSCGASILNSLWLLTAAHCLGFHDSQTGEIYGYNPVEMRLVIGSSRISLSGQVRQVRNCSEALIHPEFVFSSVANDIGMVKATKAISFTHSVGVVKIPKKVDPSEDPKPVGKCVLLGWGGTMPSKNTSQGDSGGPLMCNGVQWGIVSGNRACGQPGRPGVFTRVDAYLSLIHDVMGSQSRNGSLSSENSSSHLNILVLFFVAKVYSHQCQNSI